jgi:hypothetical protein
MKMDVDLLARLVSYHPECGTLTWNRRDAWVVDAGLQTEQGRKRFNTRFAGQPCFVSVDKDGYFFGSILGQFYRAHSVAYALHNGRWAQHTVDHINRDRTDNRAENLRDATRAQQQQNRRRQINNKSGVPGVHFNSRRKKWVVRSERNGVRANIGYFASKNDAIAAKRDFER